MTEEIKVKKPKVEKTSVEIMLEKIQADMAELKEDNKKKDEKIAMLTDIANESRKEKWTEKNIRNKIVSVVKLSILDGKIITSWKNTVDEVYKNSNGDWIENQINVYRTEDEKDHTMTLLDAVRKIVKIEAEVLSVAVDNEKEGKDDTIVTTYIYKVKTKEGKIYEISSKFIN